MGVLILLFEWISCLAASWMITGLHVLLVGLVWVLVVLLMLLASSMFSWFCLQIARLWLPSPLPCHSTRVIVASSLVTLAHFPLCGIHSNFLEMFDDCGLSAWFCSSLVPLLLENLPEWSYHYGGLFWLQVAGKVCQSGWLRLVFFDWSVVAIWVIVI